jgi:hypothetical protein
MAILFVREQFLNRDGDGSEKAERSYTRIWKVGVDSLLHDSRTILAAPTLPHLFDLYVGADGSVDELGATCRKLSARHIEDFVWEVTARYSNKTQQAEKGNPNPLLRPVDISSDGVTFQKPIDFTPDGAPICSSTGERFDPAVTVDDSRRTYLFVRNEAEPSALANDYKDVTNSDTWLGYPPGTAKVGVIKETRVDENNFYYWKVSYPISVNLYGWDAKVMDVGTKWSDAWASTPTGQTHYIFTDATNAPLSGPQPLNGEGGPLHMQGVPAHPAAPGASSKLVSGIGIGNIIVNVLSGAGYPQLDATYPIVLKIDSELMLATEFFPGSSSFNVVRGYGGSTAVAHAGGKVVQMQPYYLTFKCYRRLPFAALALG